MWCITGSFAAFLATLVLTEYMGKPGFFVWICLIYGLSCGIWTVAPSTLARLFGASNMSVNYGFINLAIVSLLKYRIESNSCLFCNYDQNVI